MFENIVGIEVDGGMVHIVGESEVAGIVLREVSGEMATVPWFEIDTSYGKIMVNGKYVKQVFTETMPEAYRLWVDGVVK
jgi:hypothetical protein